MEPSSNKYEKITIPMQNKNSVIFNLESIDLNIFYHKDKKSINIEYEKIINESLNNNLENIFTSSNPASSSITLAFFDR